MLSNLPPGVTQEQLDDRFYSIEVIDHACDMFETDDPTDEQLEEAELDLLEEVEI